MGRSFGLGRCFGIEVKVHWTFSGGPEQHAQTAPELGEDQHAHGPSRR